MASTSGKAPSSAPILQKRLIDGQEYISEHPFKEEKTKIWENQIFIPFTLNSKPLACLGPLPSTPPSAETPVENKEAFFPTCSFHSPLIAETKPITLHYVERNFRTAPSLNCPKFTAWMKRLEPSKVVLWRDLGIHTLLEFLCQGQPYSRSMLLAALHFWEGSTNTFHTRCELQVPLNKQQLTSLQLAQPQKRQFLLGRRFLDYATLSVTAFLLLTQRPLRPIMIN